MTRSSRPSRLARRITRHRPGLSLVGALSAAVGVGAAFVFGRSPGWATVKRLIRLQFPDVRRVTTEQLEGWLDDPERQSPLLLDVRAEDEYAVSHLPGAIHVPPDAGIEELLASVTEDRPIVAYCSVGYRSSVMARRLREAGFEEVANLEGSIFQWANEGRPVVRGGEQVEEVHPYDDRWGRLLDRRLHPRGREE
ncbi:rhodanese-like domain-containing protein [Tautonia plasticadhaerens]|uniref:Putative adenylyltransferase/sulfurtransferase MoeZ n=1 Tax=Tautonia plasticadhaerens TaxID=2527974 RepID=A0A518H6C5_9BACT|nr:rhodanese-like domain-containing protein [Tautonia plasticadhaerens]QDV36389.1 putative adenylyltransferase/sulfurtransferase MoeZ [Tautonia plasticadhaerens]